MACISNNFFVLTLYILQKIFSPNKENYMFNNQVQKNESYYIQSAISFYHKISFVDVKLISGAFVHFKTNYHITQKNVNRTTLIYLVTKSYFKNKIIYKKYLPYQSESVFHFPAKRMFKFSTSTTQTFVFKFFSSQIHIYLLYILRKRRKVYQDRSCQSVYYGFTIRQARQLLYYFVIEKNFVKTG